MESIKDSGLGSNIHIIPVGQPRETCVRWWKFPKWSPSIWTWSVVLEDASAQSVQTSPFGVIPIRGKPDNWRLILDLTSPIGHSINDGIDPARCLLKYASIDQAVSLCCSLGVAPLLSKLDIKSTYHMVLVHPDNCHLQAHSHPPNLGGSTNSSP